MTPRVLEGGNAKYIFFPEATETILNKSGYATVYVGANADTKEKVILKKISPALFGNDSQRFKFFATVCTEVK